MEYFSRRYLTGWLLVVGVSLGATQPSFAQDAAKAKANAQADSAALNSLFADFSAPDLTAPTLLGVNTAQVSKPANVRALAGSLLGAAVGAQQNGAGIGVEVAPVLLTHYHINYNSDGTGLATSLQNYRHPINRALRGFTVSGASITDSLGAKVSLGLGLVLIDQTDPLLDANRVQRIAGMLRQLNAIKVIHQTVAANGAAANQRTDNLVYTKAGISKSDTTIRAKVFDPLKELLLFPTDVTATSDDFTAQRSKDLQAWQNQINVLVTSGILTANQASILLAEAPLLVHVTTVEYLSFKTAFTDFKTITQDSIKKANDDFDKHLWNATIIQAGGGRSWNSRTKTWRGLQAQTTGLFLRGALRGAPISFSPFLYNHVQFVGLIQRNWYSSPTTNAEGLPTKPTATADSLAHKTVAGGRVLVGNASFRVSAEYAMQRYGFTQAAQDAAVKAKRTLRDDVRTVTIGAEVRLAEKLWLEFAFGTMYSAGERKDAKLLTLGSLKYAIRNSQRFKTN